MWCSIYNINNVLTGLRRITSQHQRFLSEQIHQNILFAYFFNFFLLTFHWFLNELIQFSSTLSTGSGRFKICSVYLEKHTLEINLLCLYTCS